MIAKVREKARARDPKSATKRISIIIIIVQKLWNLHEATELRTNSAAALTRRPQVLRASAQLLELR
jgi:hypothetical protein